jgi:hypothetical protein
MRDEEGPDTFAGLAWGARALTLEMVESVESVEMEVRSFT